MYTWNNKIDTFYNKTKAGNESGAAENLRKWCKISKK